MKTIRAILFESDTLSLPGVTKVVGSLRDQYYLVVVSGALRGEVEEVLGEGGLLDSFRLIVDSDGVTRGKPDSGPYLTAVKLLNRDHVPEAHILLPEECLAVEDSPWGIESARKAGMKCVAVTTSCSAEKLKGADRVVQEIGELLKYLEL